MVPFLIKRSLNAYFFSLLGMSDKLFSIFKKTAHLNYYQKTPQYKI